MDIVILIGRILFGAVFVGGALGHFTQTAAMAAYTESKGIKPGKLAVLGSGAWMLTGAALVIAGAWADLGALMLAAFLLPTAFVMHPFWNEGTRRSRPASRSTSTRTCRWPAPPWRCSASSSPPVPAPDCS